MLKNFFFFSFLFLTIYSHVKNYMTPDTYKEIVGYSFLHAQLSWEQYSARETANIV